MDGTKLTGLWKNTDKNGQTFLSGSLGLAKLLVMPNGFKKAEKDPDYYAVLVTPEKKDRPAPLASDFGGL